MDDSKFLQEFLVLRCSEKDKWIVFYFSVILNCNVCILETLYYTSLAFVELRQFISNSTFLVNLISKMAHMIERQLGESKSSSPTARWLWGNLGNRITLLLFPNGVTLRWPDFDHPLFQTTFFLENRVLYFSMTRNREEKETLKAGDFGWIMNNCIEQTLKLYRP